MIIGDSIVKHLDARRLKRSDSDGKQKVYVESYRGANTDAMKYHIKPCLTRKPEKIILHIGSNDLRDKAVKQTVDNIGHICTNVNDESPATRVAISELIIRTDKDEYIDKINKVNKQIIKLCEKHKWDYIKHASIKKII